MKLPFAKRPPVVTRHVPPAVEAPRRDRRPRPLEEAPRPSLEPGAADVRRRLLAAGASDELCESVLRAVVGSDARGTFAIDAAARVIGGLFQIQPSPRRAAGAPYLIAFVGTPGSGKTSTLAKLGRRLQGVGRRVAYASFDPQGLAALQRVGGLESDVDRTEVPLAAVRRASDLRRFVQRAGAPDVVLVDTPGFSPRDERELARFADELARARTPERFDCYAVLPATSSRAALRLACDALAPLAPDAGVLTRLDETSAPAPALECLREADLPVAFLCDGQDVRGHLFRPTRDHFADLLLRGKLS